MVGYIFSFAQARKSELKTRILDYSPIVGKINKLKYDVTLNKLEEGFAALNGNKILGTTAAGDGVVFRTVMLTNEEVEGDVKSYYVRKEYFTYGLQAFFDAIRNANS